MKGKIRTANKRDIAAKHHRVLPRSKKELLKVLGAFFVFEADGKIIGCCALEIYSSRIAEIRSLVIDKDYQNNGIGTILIKACLTRAEKKKIQKILSVTDKVDVFRKCGFDTCLNDQYAMFANPKKIKL